MTTSSLKLQKYSGRGIFEAIGCCSAVWAVERVPGLVLYENRSARWGEVGWCFDWWGNAWHASNQTPGGPKDLTAEQLSRLKTVKHKLQGQSFRTRGEALQALGTLLLLEDPAA